MGILTFCEADVSENYLKLGLGIVSIYVKVRVLFHIAVGVENYLIDHLYKYVSLTEHIFEKSNRAFPTSMLVGVVVVVVVLMRGCVPVCGHRYLLLLADISV